MGDGHQQEPHPLKNEFGFYIHSNMEQTEARFKSVRENILFKEWLQPQKQAEAVTRYVTRLLEEDAFKTKQLLDLLKDTFLHAVLTRFLQSSQIHARNAKSSTEIVNTYDCLLLQRDLSKLNGKYSSSEKDNHFYETFHALPHGRLDDEVHLRTRIQN